MCCGGTDDGATDDRLAFLFTDRPDNPKSNRVNLPSRGEIVAFLGATRARTFAALDACDLDAPGLTREGYAWIFADQHECQHQETIAELLTLLAPRGDASGEEATIAPAGARMALVPGGEFIMGASTMEAYDNEAQPHVEVVAPFRLAEAPVTVAEWRGFVAEGGYDREALWTAPGWEWAQRARAFGRPEYWTESHHDRHYRGGAGADRRRARDGGLGARGRRLRAMVRGCACPPRSSGSARRHAREGATPGATRSPPPERAVFGLTPGSPQSVTSCGAGGHPRRRPAPGGERLGVDELGFPALPGLPRAPLRRLLEGPYVRRAPRLPGRELGDLARDPAPHLPQLVRSLLAAGLSRAADSPPTHDRVRFRDEALRRRRGHSASRPDARGRRGVVAHRAERVRQVHARADDPRAHRADLGARRRERARRGRGERPRPAAPGGLRDPGRRALPAPHEPGQRGRSWPAI